MSQSPPPTEEKPTEEKSGHGRSLFIWGIILVILPAFYVLSIGPVFGLFFWFQIQPPSWLESVILGFYAPIFWISDLNDSFADSMQMYIYWWIERF